MKNRRIARSKMADCVVLVLAFLATHLLVAQSSLLPLAHPDYITAQRMEIKSGRLSLDYQATILPIDRKAITTHISSADTGALFLNSQDRKDIYEIFKRNYEWNERGEILSKKPFLKHFYHFPADMFAVNTPELRLRINPVIEFAMGKQTDNDHLLLTNSRGLEIRGDIGKKLGFYTMVSDNQAVFPDFVRQPFAIPYEGRFAGYTPFYAHESQGYDFFKARGHICFSPIKQIQISFGHDKHFIGDGVRSLMLSDYSNAMPFLRIQTRVWKWQYTNLFLQPTVQFQSLADTSLVRKFMAIHHLSINLCKRWNLGLMESVVAHRPHGAIDPAYLNPLIFYRWVEHNLGSPDNVMIGATSKYLFHRNVLLFGQLIVDEFSWEAISARNGDWRVKYGCQIGGRYIDAFGVSHLDIQAEYNTVRPYTYAHINTNINYSNYNLPLAHPLGSNFKEIMGLISYSPVNKLTMDFKLILQWKGWDSTELPNAGGNIFVSPASLTTLTGNKTTQGLLLKTQMAHLQLAYKLRLPLTLYVEYLTRQTQTGQDKAYLSHIFMAGISVNVYRKSWYY